MPVGSGSRLEVGKSNWHPVHPLKGAGDKFLAWSKFPDCICENSLVKSPYRMVLASSTAKPHGNTYCFRFQVLPCVVENECCHADIYKIEMPVRECACAQKGHGW